MRRRRSALRRATLALLPLTTAFEVTSVQVLASQLLPVGHTLRDGQTLSELSACRFVDTDTALFVDDKGALVEADVALDPFAVNPVRRTALQPSADSEGIAIERDGTVLVSTEAHAHKGANYPSSRSTRSREVFWERPSRRRRTPWIESSTTRASKL